MIYDHDNDDDDMDDDQNDNHGMDITTTTGDESTTNTNHDTATTLINPHDIANQDEVNNIRKEPPLQQQCQNLETWLQLIETAIQPFQPLNEALLSADSIRTRQPPQYTIQHGILPSQKNDPSGVVGSSMVKTITNSRTNEDIIAALPSDAAATSGITSNILIASVTLLAGQPSISAPKQGDIIVTLTHNNTSATGSSTSHSLLTMQSKLQRILDENMDLEQLHIVEGKIAYRLVVTVTILFAESITSATLFDVCLVAAVAALLDTKLPTHPIINDGVLYSASTLPSVGNDCDDDDTVHDTTDTNIDTKSLHMPIIPISFTAIGVRIPTSTKGMRNESHTVDSKLMWMVDPTIDEQQISNATIATIVMNAAAIAATTTAMMDGHDNDDEQNDNESEILCLQLAPTIGYSPTTSSMTSSFDAVYTSNVANTAPAVVSGIDLDNVISIAHQHVKSLFTLIQPK